MLWNSASNPWYAVNLRGTLSMSSGSTTAIIAKLLGEYADLLVRVEL